MSKIFWGKQGYQPRLFCFIGVLSTCNAGAPGQVLAPGLFQKNHQGGEGAWHAIYYAQGREALALATWSCRKRPLPKASNIFKHIAKGGVISLGDQTLSQADGRGCAAWLHKQIHPCEQARPRALCVLLPLAASQAPSSLCVCEGAIFWINPMLPLKDNEGGTSVKLLRILILRPTSFEDVRAKDFTPAK